MDRPSIRTKTASRPRSRTDKSPFRPAPARSADAGPTRAAAAESRSDSAAAAPQLTFASTPRFLVVFPTVHCLSSCPSPLLLPLPVVPQQRNRAAIPLPGTPADLSALLTFWLSFQLSTVFPAVCILCYCLFRSCRGSGIVQRFRCRGTPADLPQRSSFSVCFSRCPLSRRLSTPCPLPPPTSPRFSAAAPQLISLRQPDSPLPSPYLVTASCPKTT